MYGVRPDRHGIRLPERFTVRRVARGNEVVPGTDYKWHIASDGAATFPTADGGWILVSNCEDLQAGGAGAMRFAPDGKITDGYRILDGTTFNCAGGPTPWGTWLSCEEFEQGACGSAIPPAGARHGPTAPWACSSTRPRRSIPATATCTSPRT